MSSWLINQGLRPWRSSMATARPSVPICGLCSEAAGADGLVSLAVQGDLLAVCQRCFLLQQVGSLTTSLPRSDPVRELVEEGLRALYEVVATRAQEIAASELQYAAQTRR